MSRNAEDPTDRVVDVRRMMHMRVNAHAQTPRLTRSRLIARPKHGYGQTRTQLARRPHVFHRLMVDILGGQKQAGPLGRHAAGILRRTRRLFPTPPPQDHAAKLPDVSQHDLAVHALLMRITVNLCDGGQDG